MTDQASTPDEVDWPAVERRWRRWNLLALIVFVGFFASIVGLTGAYAFWEGRAAWLALAVFLAVGLLLQVVGRIHPRLRAKNSEAVRLQHAVRHHVDPGPGTREKADVYARRMAANGWTAWLFPFMPLGFLPQARWDRAMAVPAAVVLIGCIVAVTWWWRGQAAAARRWLSDPPGPDRTVAPPTRWERWFSGRRLMWILVGLMGTTVLTAVLAALLSGD